MVRTRPRRDRARHDLEVGHLDPLVAPVADQPDVDQPAAVAMQGQAGRASGRQDRGASDTVTMTVLNASARALLESDALVHLVTLNADGSPQVSCVWVGLDGDEIVSGHLDQRQKLRNVRRDPRVVLSVEASGSNPIGLREYLVVHGTARVEAGGASELLQRLAHVYFGPDVVFPPPEHAAPGYILRVTPERVGGVGPWTD
jgi:PPOX class probable F420-dependent enzyme